MSFRRPSDRLLSWSQMILFSSLFWCLTASPGFAQTSWYVAPEGDDSNDGLTPGSPFASIKTAVAAAGDGDLVLLADGIYVGEDNRNIDFGVKSITVRSSSGDRDACVVDAEGSAEDQRVAFLFTGGQTTAAALEDLTVTGGYPAGVLLERTGPLSSSPRIQNLIIEFNPGHGVLISSDDFSVPFNPVVVDCVIRENVYSGLRSEGFGGGFEMVACDVHDNGEIGVSADGSWYTSLTDTEIRAKGGDGFRSTWTHPDPGTPLLILRCQIHDNGGWGVYNHGEDNGLLIEETIVRENELGGVYSATFWAHSFIHHDSEILANGGPGIATAYFDFMEVSDSRIIGNADDGIADAWWHGVPGVRGQTLEQPRPRWILGRVTGCLVSKNGGAGIHLQGAIAPGGLITLANSVVAGNTESGIVLGAQTDEEDSFNYLISSLTVADNGGHGIDYSSINLPCTVENSIIAGNEGLALQAAQTDLLSIACSDFHGNGEGDWTGNIEPYLGVDGNFSANSQFCNPFEGDFTLLDTSPCLPGNHPDGVDCGLIGAREADCTASDVSWLTASPLESGPFGCDEPAPLTFHFAPVAGTSPIRGYEVRLLASAPLLITTDDVTIFTVPDSVATFSQVVENAPGDLTVNYAILGDSGQIDTAADLFLLQVHGDATGTGTVEIVSLRFRDFDNDPVYVIEGPAATIAYACTAPDAVSDVTASPGHEQTDVAWAHNGEHTDHYAVFRGLWYADDTETSAYPEYNLRVPNTIPTRPASYVDAVASPEWQLAGTVPEGILEFTDDTMTPGRGVYYYEVFALDVIENASPPAETNDRATNYWLGDVEPDGLVDITDASRFGDSFGVCMGHDVFDPECDFGPTDDNRRFGIPVPDGCVDFEDLMIFAMNFGRVEPGKALPAFDATVHLAWIQIAEGLYALRLIGGEGVQGLRLRAVLPAGSDVTVQAGDLLHQQTSPTFLRNVGQALDVNVAIIGAGAGFTGTGELFTVATSTEISGADLAITVRSLDNTELEISFDQVTGVEIPTVFSLSANFPNPFNPATTIRFALPEPQHVNLGVYGVDGRRVALLVSESRAAGVHEATWTGKDDHGRLVASGTYFYRIDAGPHRQVRKMVLMK